MQLPDSGKTAIFTSIVYAGTWRTGIKICFTLWSYRRQQPLVHLLPQDKNPRFHKHCFARRRFSLLPGLVSCAIFVSARSPIFTRLIDQPFDTREEKKYSCHPLQNVRQVPSRGRVEPAVSTCSRCVYDDAPRFFQYSPSRQELV